VDLLERIPGLSARAARRAALRAAFASLVFGGLGCCAGVLELLEVVPAVGAGVVIGLGLAPAAILEAWFAASERKGKLTTLALATLVWVLTAGLVFLTVSQLRIFEAYDQGARVAEAMRAGLEGVGALLNAPLKTLLAWAFLSHALASVAVGRADTLTGWKGHDTVEQAMVPSVRMALVIGIVTSGPLAVYLFTEATNAEAAALRLIVSLSCGWLVVGGTLMVGSGLLAIFLNNLIESADRLESKLWPDLQCRGGVHPRPSGGRG
jgi:hypothetical protein